MIRQLRPDEASSVARNRHGVTLVEVLVTISITGFMISLLLNGVQQVRAKAAQTQCVQNLRQISLALHGYEAAHGSFPNKLSDSAHAPDNLLNWHALILPYIEQEPLWRSSAAACAVTTKTHNSSVHRGYVTAIKVFACPNDGRLGSALTTPTGDRAAFSSYLGVSGSAMWTNFPGIFSGYQGGATVASVTDGLSNTLMVGERPPPDSLQAGRWYSSRWIPEPFGGYDGTMPIPALAISPDDAACRLAKHTFGPGRLANACDRLHYWSLHHGGANFAFADGSVRFLPYSAARLLPLLATRAGGEVVSIPN